MQLPLPLFNFVVLLALACYSTSLEARRLRWFGSFVTARRTTVIRTVQSWKKNKLPLWVIRGGDETEAQEDASNNEDDDDQDHSFVEDATLQEIESEGTATIQRCPEKMPSKVRRTSEMIWDLRRRSGVSENDESIELRQLVSNRAREYLEDLKLAVENNENKLPHPKKLLHYLAPKVPAIKQSPDVNLRIHSARSDMDSGLAACIISTVAYACEIYDTEILKRSNSSDGKKPASAAPDLTTDRRFEQLVECVLSGVSVKKRKRESLSRRLEESTEDGADIEEILDEENVQEDDGLKIRDSCRAAWGVAVLGAHHLDTLGGEKVLDLFLALSLRVRELLLARLQNLRQHDLLSEEWMSNVSPEARLNELAEELAEDAVSCMWAFACVQSCTGETSPALFEACSSILCQDPIEMRKRAEVGNAQELGSSDVVHRLAHSEVESNYTEDATQPTIIVGKDAFLDWLSPTEMSDVLWALALHGNSNSTSTSDESSLSDTAMVLREIAFDRILDFLQLDLHLSDEVPRGLEEPNQSHLSKLTNGDQVTTIEVVDAATLLASSEDSKADLGGEVESLPVENISVLSGVGSTNIRQIQEVEVVDAARLLASESGAHTNDSTPEAIVTAPPDTLTVEDPALISSNEMKQNPPARTMSNASPLFTPHDLASMAWSVTELRDSLRIKVVGIIVELLSRSGRTSLESVSSSDLANLAWAISKYQKDAIVTESSRSSLTAVSVIQWVSQSALERMNSSPNTDVFQPPELGRLMWALAYSRSSFSNISHSMKFDKTIVELSQTALDTAARNLALFATEDLLRIVWAFVEICEGATGNLSTLSAISLGRVLSTIEQSLHRWEHGGCPTAAPDSSSSASFSGFSSFFGRPRKNLPSLDFSDAEKDDDYGAALAHVLEKPKRPKLRDLSIDPSTLCKAACGFQRLAKSNSLMNGGWMLTRVAMRLLTSTDARLMKECSINDIVRICEAAALTDTGGHGRELLLGFFARKVLQVLNQSLEEGKNSNMRFEISEATTQEISTLLWALGELGARHSLQNDNETNSLAYKKMRLVSSDAFISKEDVNNLDKNTLIRLFRGLVLMRFNESDRKFLLTVMKEIESTARTLKTGEEICNLAESVGLLRETLKPPRVIEDESKENLNTKADREAGTLEEDSPAENTSEDSADEADIEKEFWDCTSLILQEIGSRAQNVKEKLTGSELRRILAVYSLLPFQADELVDGFEEEISRRLSLSSETRSELSLAKSIERAQSESQELNRTLFKEADNSAFNSIKQGLISLFQTVDENKDMDDKSQENKLTEDVASSINKLVSSISDVSERAREWSSRSLSSIDPLMVRVDEAAMFEYGRCQELIAHYRRVEFSTGTFRSRYDKERRKDIGKRVSSRLLP